MGDVGRILDRLAAGELDQDAVKDVRRSDLAELNRETVVNLRRALFATGAHPPDDLPTIE